MAKKTIMRITESDMKRMILETAINLIREYTPEEIDRMWRDGKEQENIPSYEFEKIVPPDENLNVKPYNGMGMSAQQKWTDSEGKQRTGDPLSTIPGAGTTWRHLSKDVMGNQINGGNINLKQ